MMLSSGVSTPRRLAASGRAGGRQCRSGASLGV